MADNVVFEVKTNAKKLERWVFVTLFFLNKIIINFFFQLVTNIFYITVTDSPKKQKKKPKGEIHCQEQATLKLR